MSERHIAFGGRRVGSGHPCLVIGEVGQAHDGSVAAAHAYIDAIAEVGADAVKFQTHIAAAESTLAEPWRVKFSDRDETRLDYWRRMEFTEDEWHALKDHATERGLLFLSSPFSVEAAELLHRVGVPAWKVASGELNNTVLLDYLAATGLPVLLSTGMSPWPEIDAAVERLRGFGLPFAVFQCTSDYPCPPAKTGLNVIAEVTERYDCPAGLSDHSGTIFPGLAAAALGANLLEVHVALGRDDKGPDVNASVTVVELRQLVDGVRFIEAALANPVDKDAEAGRLAPLRAIFTKSVVTRRDLPKGTILAAADLTVKKPGTGIPAAEMENLIGRRLIADVEADELLQTEHLDPKDKP